MNIFSTDINPMLVFWGGIASFVSPCVLPIIPIYISNLAGIDISNGTFDKRAKKKLIINTLGFILGISFVFMLLGVSATIVGKTLNQYRDIIRKVGAVIVILLGLNYTGILNISIFNNQKRFNLKNYKPNFISSFILGFTFSFGWTPCISAFLTPVLVLASMQQYMLKAITLLLIYAIGFCIPFIVLSFLASKGITRLRLSYNQFKIIKMLGGILLIIMGLLLFTNYLNILIF